ncbi:MAG: chemotaxis protein CheV [Sedimentisphaerales bacterium]|nr:chemotaxis protein CheV [Sedimentisphaerales bacterium]MBN2841475.1 chemotaxis protein CheV [Sedimentisphaerales bacterium]
MEKGILLEAGTNELELLVFKVGNTPYGINVAKIREIVQRQKTISIPMAPHSVEGSIRLREEIISLINLGAYFGVHGNQTEKGEGMIIVVEFNKIRCGILVDSVERIHRLSWSDIVPPSDYLQQMNAPITATVNLPEYTILIIDFETVISTVLGAECAEVVEVPNEKIITEISSEEVRVIMADDSAIIRKTVERVLRKNNFNNLTICHDGQEVWNYIQAHQDDPDGPCDIVVTDIEMPGMDGLHLTMKIKDEPKTKNIPVILFSSLINQDNIKKGQSVGADAQVSKPNSSEMIATIYQCLKKYGIHCKEAQMAEV